MTRVEILTRDVVNGDPLIRLVQTGPARFVVRPDSAATPVTWSLVLAEANVRFGVPDWCWAGPFLRPGYGCD